MIAFPCLYTIALLSLWAIANAQILIGQEFSQLVYVFEFLSENHASNPFVGELSEFSFKRDFPRLTEERYTDYAGKALQSWREVTGS
jgi:hypothetical protein